MSYPYRNRRKNWPRHRSFRPRRPSLTMNALIGSATHWTLRGLISGVSQRFGVRLPNRVEWILAYILTGLLLLSLGVWNYLPWKN